MTWEHCLVLEYWGPAPLCSGVLWASTIPFWSTVSQHHFILEYCEPAPLSSGELWANTIQFWSTVNQNQSILECCEPAPLHCGVLWASTTQLCRTVSQHYSVLEYLEPAPLSSGVQWASTTQFWSQFLKDEITVILSKEDGQVGWSRQYPWIMKRVNRSFWNTKRGGGEFFFKLEFLFKAGGFQMKTCKRRNSNNSKFLSLTSMALPVVHFCMNYPDSL